MDAKKSNRSTRDATHLRLMRSILKGIDDSPLVLKGGTSLLLAYGLDRFSEDLDFDAPLKINLESRIRRSLPVGIALNGIDTVKDTTTVTRYRVRYQSEHGEQRLKLEISYRTPVPASEIRSFQGLRVACLPRIIDQKLKAAHDGDDPRAKVRDLYDLDFLARRWPATFTNELAARFRTFSADPDALVSKYQPDYDEDDLIPDLIELEQLALRAHCLGEELFEQRTEIERRFQNLPSLKDTAGSAYTFWRHGVEELKTASMREANWHKVELNSIQESIVEHLQSAEEVAQSICSHSPGATSFLRQAEIRDECERVAAGISGPGGSCGNGNVAVRSLEP